MAATAPLHFKTSIGRLAHLTGMHYLEVPPEVVHALGGRFNVRLQCTVNGALTFQCGLVALGGGSGYISLRSARMKELRVRQGDTVEVLLQPDDSAYGTEVPDELAELLEQDVAGRERFDTLSAGKQRYIIQYVADVKSSQLRIDRAVRLLENLKQLAHGKESFRAMLGLPPRR